MITMFNITLGKQEMTQRLGLALTALLFGACSDAETVNTTDSQADGIADALNVPDSYNFTSRFEEGSSVAYSGQVARLTLIRELSLYLDRLSESVDQGTDPGDVASALDFYLRFDVDTAQGVALEVSSRLPLTQQDISELGARSLVEKIAGEDARGQHKDWTQDFVGWDAASPLALADAWRDELAALAQARFAGNPERTPEDEVIEKAYIDAEGRDYRQLLEKFLRGAIALSQAADDYLDDDLEDHGLNSDNSAAVEGKSYTGLEHVWDEGFGYFGAARDYKAYNDAELASRDAESVREDYAQAVHDTDGNGTLDLFTEVNVLDSTNAAKRDLGGAADTDFTAQAIDGFLTGRALITDAAGPLTDTQMAALKTARDQAMSAWESALAATAVHYVNDTLRDTLAIGTDDYSFEDHAKHWSELKGFALSFQFNPRSALSETDFVALHDELGNAPAITLATRDDYIAALLRARDILGDAFGFSAAQLGNDQGEEGW